MPALSLPEPYVPPRDKDANGVFSTPAGWTLSAGELLLKQPKGDLTTGIPILAAMGSFWARYFQDRGELISALQGGSLRAIQTYIDWLETLAAVDRFTVPVFHRREWYAIVLKESTLGTGDLSLLKYGGSGEYDATYQYGVPIADECFCLDPGDFERIGVLMNRIVDPSVAWVDGTDFTIDKQGLVLRSNPFEDGRFPVKNILDSTGTRVDREVVLWAFDMAEDWEYIYQHFGYAIRRKMASSEFYRDFVNALWNSFVGGLSTQDFEWAVAAVTGLPTVKEARETIEAIIPYPGRKTVIVTDQHGYIYPDGSVARYGVGDAVYAGQTLVDTVRTFDLANYDDIVELLQAVRTDDTGAIVLSPDPTDSSSSNAGDQTADYLGHRDPSKIKPSPGVEPLLHALPIGRSLLGKLYGGGLTFLNTIGALDISELDTDGVIVAKVAPVGGGSDDLDLFWDTAHTNGLNKGKTWLQLLGMPRPVYVNPAGWVIEHFLRNNTVVVYLRYTKFGEKKLGLQLLELLRRVLPPEKLVIFIIDVEVEDTDAIDTSGEETDSAVTDDTSSIANGITDLDPLIFDVNACE